MIENLKGEIWKDIKGYKGWYQVSNIGRVKSLDRKIIDSMGRIYSYKGKLLKLSLTHDGYLYVSLAKNGNARSRTINNLVAEAFIPNPSNLPEVNHKDEDKLNNKVSNLEWCTRKYNINYGTGIQKRSKSNSGKNNPNFGKPRSSEVKNKISMANKGKTRSKEAIEKIIKSNQKSVINIDTHKKFESLKHAGQYYNINPVNICRCCKGRIKTAGGYQWTYE